jgi:tetratricopeptide (TPR) repeat protein
LTALAVMAAGMASAHLHAQDADAFAHALIAFTTAQQGTFGDEGPQLTAALAALERGLAEWDREIARTRAAAAGELRTATPEQAARIRIAQGIEDLRRGRYRAAADAFEAAAAADDTALSLRGLVDEAEGRSAGAAEWFRRAWERRPRDLAAAYKAWQYRSTYADETRARLQQTFLAIASAPSDVQRIAFPSTVLVPDGGPPLLPLAAYADGYRLIAAHRLAEGVAKLRAAAAADALVSGDASESVRRGIAALRAGRRDESRTILEGAVAASPGSSEARRALALALWLDDQYANSASHLEAAVRAAPGDERARVALARVLVQAERLEDAKRVLLETIDILPDSASSHWWLFTIYSSLNRGADALAFLAKPAALSGVRGRGEVYAAISQQHEIAGNFEGAIASLRQRANLTPNDPTSHLALARAHVHLDQLDAALVEFVMTLALDPREPAAHVGIGQIHLGAGRLPEAVRTLQRGLALQPSNAEGRYALATALTRLSRQAEAAPHLAEYARLQAAATLQRRQKMTMDVLREEAALRTRNGETKRAIELWRQAVADEPDNAANHAGLASALAADDQLAAAIASYEEAVKRGGSARVYRDLATLYERADRPQDARRALESYERALQSVLRPGAGNQ